MENNENLDGFDTSTLPQFNAPFILNKLKQGGITNFYEVEGNKILVKSHKYVTITIAKDKEGNAKISHSVEIMNPYSIGIGIFLAIIFMIFNVLGNVAAVVIATVVGRISYDGEVKTLKEEVYEILISEWKAN